MIELPHRSFSPKLLLLFALVGGMSVILFYGQTFLADGATFYVSDVPTHHSLIRQWAEGDLVIPYFGLALLVTVVRALTPFDYVCVAGPASGGLSRVAREFRSDLHGAGAVGWFAAVVDPKRRTVGGVSASGA